MGFNITTSLSPKQPSLVVHLRKTIQAIMREVLLVPLVPQTANLRETERAITITEVAIPRAWYHLETFLRVTHSPNNFVYQISNKQSINPGNRKSSNSHTSQKARRRTWNQGRTLNSDRSHPTKAQIICSNPRYYILTVI